MFHVAEVGLDVEPEALAIGGERLALQACLVAGLKPKPRPPRLWSR